MRDYPFTVAALDTKADNVTANLIRYKEGDKPIKVTAWDHNGVIVLSSLMYPGQSFRVVREFERVTLYNPDIQVSVTGVLIMGNGEFQDDRIPGTVIVEGEADSWAKDGSSFGACKSWKPPAGFYGQLALINKDTADKYFYVDEVSLDSISHAFVELYNIVDPAGDGWTFESYGINKFSSETPSIDGIWYRDRNSLPGSTYLLEVFQGSYTSVRNFKSPIILPPRGALVITNTSPNDYQVIGFSWTERPIYDQ